MLNFVAWRGCCAQLQAQAGAHSACLPFSCVLQGGWTCMSSTGRRPTGAHTSSTCGPTGTQARAATGGGDHSIQLGARASQGRFHTCPGMWDLPIRLTSWMPCPQVGPAVRPQPPAPGHPSTHPPTPALPRPAAQPWTTGSWRCLWTPPSPPSGRGCGAWLATVRPGGRPPGSLALLPCLLLDRPHICVSSHHNSRSADA